MERDGNGKFLHESFYIRPHFRNIALAMTQCELAEFSKVFNIEPLGVLHAIEVL
jgi:hypothetical protein